MFYSPKKERKTNLLPLQFYAEYIGNAPYSELQDLANVYFCIDSDFNKRNIQNERDKE